MGTKGHFIPPALIFPRKNWKHELLDGAPVGTLGLVQEKGWITEEVFLQWLEHFCQHVKARLEDKVAFGKAVSVKTAQSGFEKTGLCPVNADIFEDHQFAPSETTDRPKEPANAEEFPSSSTSFTNAAKESSTPSLAADTNISPLPTSDKVTAKRRATQGPTELTSTPNIKMTKQKAEEKKSRVQRQSKRIVKKRLEFSQEEADDSFDDVDDNDDDDDEACLYFNDLYSQSKPKET
ncbi:hypothetical protein ANN_19267, partial [Periplaneta americana]